MQRISNSRAILIIAAVLAGFGLISIYGASSLKGAQQFGDEFLFLRKQGVSVFIGCFLIFGIQLIPLHWLSKITLPLFAFTFFLLALIFIPGTYSRVGGASRWLNIPYIGGQPSELAKIAMILFLSKNLSRKGSDVQNFSYGILPNFFFLGSLTILLLLQKDLGTPVLLFLLSFCMLFVAGLNRYFVASIASIFAILLSIAVILEPYRIARILSFIDPWSQVKGSGFQIIQSFLAFSNGGLIGVGLGESKQKLFFLPEAHTDFILSVIGEEMGLFGVLTIVFCFLLIAIIGLRISINQPDSYRRFLAFGCSVLIVLEALLNMGVVMGLLPTKGLPLPLVSSGSSSLLVFLCICGILAKLGRNSEAQSKGM